MESLRDRPIWTRVLSGASDLGIEEEAIFIHGESAEERIGHVEDFRNALPDRRFMRLSEESGFSFAYLSREEKRVVSLRSMQQISAFWKDLSARHVYLDITGLPHHIWAPLLRSALENRLRLVVIYAEPFEYRYNVLPTEGEIFDLSDRILGISPIPGFSVLREPIGELVCFVPILGFEGRRFAYVVEQVQPPGNKIVPIVGVPGFRPEFPFHAFFCNRAVLADSRSWKQVRFATANDPFSLYYLLEDIAKDYPNHLMKIAPIGTKPHALGAILFRITAENRVELVYDHPIRKAKRTQGRARLLAYDISAFLGT